MRFANFALWGNSSPKRGARLFGISGRGAEERRSCSTMPDLTFSEIELERNALGKTASSETWLDGVVVSSAEATRKRIPNVQTSQAEAVAAAAKARGEDGYDAGHWYWQPVGGRAVRCRRHARPRT